MVDVDQALADLRYAATDLVELTHTSAQLPEPLIRSEVLFAPTRILPSTMERVLDRNHGRYVPIQLREGAALIDAAVQAASAAQHARAAFEILFRPTATTERSTHGPTHGHARRELEPATGLVGLDLL
jgi:hypothetical protein